MAFSCKSAALLASHERDSDIAVAAEKFGYHFGLAFQVIDDLLDFTGSTDALGKPALSDMEQGLATAPTLFAAEEFPEIEKIVQRRFADEGDVATVSELVSKSDGLRRSRDLAVSHAQSAADALGVLPPSLARDALLRLCFDVLNRQA